AVYVLDAGTMTGPLVLDTAAAGAGVSPQDATAAAMPAPVLTNNLTPVSGGPPGVYGTAVKVVSGPGSAGVWQVVPGASYDVDAGAWAGTYTMNVQYTVAVGP
ncbi:MAG TPA: hypothetical protein VKV25_09575, partial [Acidimicrobiales bacterium]|nr:hypothetical protein [Acidimicrobiales bacterium]